MCECHNEKKVTISELQNLIVKVQLIHLVLKHYLENINQIFKKKLKIIYINIDLYMLFYRHLNLVPLINHPLH